jgi:hypothetical protein
MRSFRNVIVASLVLTIAALGGACSDSGETGEGTGLPGEGERVTVDAPVRSVEVSKGDDRPGEYLLTVVTEQANSCVRHAAIELAGRGEGSIVVRALNSEPADWSVVSCLAEVSTTESKISLGSDFEPGAQYVVTVNGSDTTFVAS